jgi:hypothetical protein
MSEQVTPPPEATDEQGNPYAPPVAGEVAWDPKDQPDLEAPIRTVAPKIFGVLSLVFAAMTIFGTLTGSCFNYVGKNTPELGKMMGQGMTDPKSAAEAYNAFYQNTFGASMASAGILAAMSVVLLVVGFGQLRYRRWARLMSVVWGWSALGALAAMIALSIFVVHPESERMAEAMAKAAPTGSMNHHFYSTLAPLISGWLSVVMTLGSYAPFPILMIKIFSKPKIIASMDQ